MFPLGTETNTLSAKGPGKQKRCLRRMEQIGMNNHYGVCDKESTRAEISNCQIVMRGQLKQRNMFVTDAVCLADIRGGEG